MDKIPFEDGTKIKNATVTVNEQEYEVTPAQYQGKVPLSAFNLNKMQDNIENTLVKVSAIEPEQKSNVWIQHAENIFDKGQAKFINAYFNADSTNIVTSSVSKCLYLEIEGNKEYCITKKASARFNIGTTSEVPNVGVNLIDNAKNVTTANEQKNANQITLKTSESAKYMVIWYYASNVDTLSEDEILNSIIVSFNIADDIKVLEGEKYVSVSPIQVSAIEPRSKVWVKYNRNMINMKVASIVSGSGVTCTINDDGSITLNGTVTKAGSYTLIKGLNLKLNGNYTFSFSKKSGTISGSGVAIAITNYANAEKYYSIAEGILSNLAITSSSSNNVNSSNVVNDIAYYLGLYFNINTVFDNFTFTLQLESGTEATNYEQYIEPDILVNDNGVYNSVLPKIIRNDISRTKTSKVTNVTRAIDNVWGKVHHINILCKVNNITTSDNVLFTTNIKAPYLTELYASNMQRVYRCLINESGQISLPNGTISTETFINISGTLII